MKNLEPQFMLDRVKCRLLTYEIPEHLSGFHLLAEAVIKKISDAYISIKNINAALASAHGKTVGAISRDMNYAVKKSDKLARLLCMPTDSLFASRVISFLAIHIKTTIYPPPPHANA